MALENVVLFVVAIFALNYDINDLGTTLVQGLRTLFI